MVLSVHLRALRWQRFIRVPGRLVACSGRLVA
jgi:hypothetical protein